MIRYIFIFLVFHIGSAFAEENKSKNILIVGDSISAAYGIEPQMGWVNLLAIKLTQEKMHYQVINASISGDLTVNGLNRLPGLLKKYTPSIVIIELGGNDGLRGVPIKVISANLEKMIVQSLEANAKVLIAGMKIPPNYGKRYTEAFQQIFIQLASAYKQPVIPFLLEGVGDKSSLMQADGIHPKAKAQPAIMLQVWKQLSLML